MTLVGSFSNSSTFRSPDPEVGEFFFSVHSLRFTVHGSQFTVYSLRFTVYGSQFTVHSSIKSESPRPRTENPKAQTPNRKPKTQTEYPMTDLFTIRHIQRMEDRIRKILEQAPAECLGDPRYIFLDAADLMQLMMINENVLKYWRQKRLIPHIRIRKKTYFRLSDVQQLIEEHRFIKQQPLAEKSAAVHNKGHPGI